MSEEQDLVLEIAHRLSMRGQKLGTAESCTGGLVAKLLTDLPGSSKWFERGVVVYSNQAKQDLLHVPRGLIDNHGAVSEEVARAMAEGVIHNMPVDWSLAITGIAGPDGGTKEKPVGLVWLAWQARGEDSQAQCLHLHGPRAQIREQAARLALQGLKDRLTL